MKICDIYFKKGNILLHNKMELMKKGMSDTEASNCLFALCPNIVAYKYAINIIKIPSSNLYLYDAKFGTYVEWINMIKYEEKLNGKFDYIAGNPPYDGNLHLKIIDAVLSLMKEDGEGRFIHPARWIEDPLAEYKKGSDKVKFKNIVDRLDDVKFIDIKTIHNKFGIIHNSDLMISTLSGTSSNKMINLYDGIAQESIDVILKYSKEHNLAQVDEKKKVDGWRCQIMDVIPVQNYADSKNTRMRTANLFSMNDKVVFYNGFDENGVEWMDTRRHTNYGKTSTSPFPHSIKFDTKEEALNFQSSCNTKFYCNIMCLLKFDMHTPLKFLPWMEDYSHAWTDEDYCKFFGDLGMSKECQEWMCRTVDDYRVKDFIDYLNFDNEE